MHDLKSDLRRAAEEFGVPSFELERVTHRARRRETVRRTSAGVTALLIVGVAGSFLVRAFATGADVPGDGVPGAGGGPISFTIAESREAMSSRFGIADGAGSSVDAVQGFPDPTTGGWSPDGSRVVFSRVTGQGTDLDLWTMARDGSGLRQLSEGPAEDLAAEFSPDGQAILFLRHEEGRSPALMVMDTTSGQARPIAGADDQVIFEAAWSPDGSEILAMGHPGEEGEPNWLAIVSADGEGWRVVFTGTFNEPSWSSDSTRIVISSRGRLLAIPVDGSEPIELAAGLDLGLDLEGLSQVAWSPDGASILYTLPVDPAHGEQLWILPVNGGAARLVADGLQWRDPAPAWAPDGGAIAFVRDGDIWAVDIGTGDQTQVTSSEEYESNPAWAART